MEDMRAVLSLNLLGDMEISRDGARLALPQSKKTRALLAYLAVTGRPHRRDRLCSLFWEMPDDPRGSLRWSLSKLRPLVDEPARRRIVADRDSVRFDAEGVEIDVLALARRCGVEPTEVETGFLEAAAAGFRGDFLEGFELGTCPDFQAWCVAERERTRQLQRGVLETLVARLADEPCRAQIHARSLVHLDPLDEEARASLIRLVGRAGHREEAARHYDDGLRLLEEAGIRSTGALKTAWREVKAVVAPATTAAAPATPTRAAPLPAQQVEYCTTSDGVRIAYSAIGEGPPIVKAANWLNHLEFDWESPVWRHWLDELTRGHRLIRYDERGNGLSDWEIGDLSLDAFVRDLEAVVDAQGLDRFTLFGISQGCAVSIAYAVRHPERVERMILYGGYAKGWRARGNPQEIAEREAMLTLVRQGWGRENPAFRQLFTSRYIPDGTQEQMRWFNDLQRICSSPENAARLIDAFGSIDVSALLAQVKAPTLVLHCRDEFGVPYAQGESLAKGLPQARFVTLESRNHLVLEHEPAWPRLVAALRGFLAEDVAALPSSPGRAASAQAAASSVALVTEAPMVGRAGERAQLDRLQADTARERRARIVLLTGEIGLGKSRLMAELAASARDAGVTVLEGGAYEAESGRPFGPWIDALRRLRLGAADQIVSAELAPLLPELSGNGGGESSRDRLFGAVSDLIAARGRAAPVLVLLDDAQWLDEESAALLHYVARHNRQHPVLIVIAARAGELDENPGLSRVLRTLRRETPIDRIALEPLSTADTESLVGAVAPGIDAARVYAESAGNPLLALEVARALQHRSDDLPQSLAELVRDRVARLPETAADALRWAAVLGPEFEQELLGQVAGMAPEALVGALETLQRHGLLRHDETVRRASATYVFVHDLVRRAIHADISAARRRLMHGRVAGMLAQDADDGEAAAGMIRHAEAAGEAALAARACIAAARRCLRLFANDEATALARRGLALAATLDDPERVKLTLELMEASFAADRPQTFDGMVAQLEDLAGRALDHGCLEHARLAYQLMGFLRWEGGNWTDARRQMLQAELVSRSADERGRVLGMSEAARCLALLERDLPEAEAMLLEAEAIGRRIGIEPVSLFSARGILRLHQGKLDEAVALFERARLVARRDGDRRAEFMALEHLATVELQRGGYAEAGRLCDELLAIGEKLREGSEAPFARALCALIRYITAVAAGEP
jgi:DNA-binding SARP family transcriptional activator/pimeloyl-ACP methyl ester carboxylesterase/tetratricopeptide (TPR) repeat protein